MEWMVAIFITNPKRALNLVTKQRTEDACRQRARFQGHHVTLGPDAGMLFVVYLWQDLKVL